MLRLKITKFSRHNKSATLIQGGGNSFTAVFGYNWQTPNDYPSFTVPSMSPDFSPVTVFTKKYFKNTLGAASVTAP